MKVFILLTAGLLAVSHTFALTLDVKYVSLIAKLALSNLNTAFIFILKGEFR